MTGPGKVPQSSITVFDSSRIIPGNLYDKIHGEFPGVVFVDHIGVDGRLKAEFKPNAIPYSITSRNATGLDTTVTEAVYLIDAALLKGHVSSGVTLCAKNLFGATSINPDWHKDAHDGFPHNRDGSPSYAAIVDFWGHKDLGEKTFLFLIDGLYGNENADPPPSHKWKMAPFNDAWPSSIFMSLDGVAIDSVGFDFLTSEWPNLVDIAMQTTTYAKPPLQTIRLLKRSTILNATAYDAAASAYLSIGTMEPTRSTRAISEKQTGLSFPVG